MKITALAPMTALALLTADLSASEQLLEFGGRRIQRNLVDLQQQAQQGDFLNNFAPAHGRQHEPTRTAPTDHSLNARNIKETIESTVRYLQDMQGENGAIAGNDGYTALAALTMLAAGATPASDDSLKRALTYLASIEPDNTYVRAVRANVWEYALRRIPHDETIRTMLRKDFEWLRDALADKEGWRYSFSSSDWDNSVTQYGVLGMWAAARAGLDPGDAFWQRMSKHFRDVQNADGGWGYQSSSSTANMATAGLATMFLVFDMYHGKNYYSRENSRAFSSGEAKACLESIERGMQWLSHSGGAYNDGYFLYGIERTGVAGGRKMIGSHDWFAQGAESLLQLRQADGSLAVSGHGGCVGGTAFSTLFLVYGGAPIAFNKLQYGGDQDWNLNPRDLANLTKHMWSAYERPLNWQTVDIKDSAAAFEAPVLFISGIGDPEFSEQDVATLRDYVARGGTIFAEPTDHSATFTNAMVALVEKLYPAERYPTHGVKPIAKDHPVYTVLRQEWKKAPTLSGASDGVRTFFFLSHDYMSAQWQLNATDSEAFNLPMNLLFYATNMRSLDGRFASALPAQPAHPARNETLRVARIQHGDRQVSQDWDRGRSCWTQYAPYITHITGCAVEEMAPAQLGPASLVDAQLVHLTGTQPLLLSADEKQALKAYVDGGGTVLVDAYAGSATFAASARVLLEELFGPMTSLQDDSILGAGRVSGGENLAHGIRYTLTARQQLRQQNQATDRQHLKVGHVKGRPALVFSEFDLTGALAGIDNYEAPGYKPASARRVVGNLVAYLMAD